jgi:hypothetical protein
MASGKRWVSDLTLWRRMARSTREAVKSSPFLSPRSCAPAAGDRKPASPARRRPCGRATGSRSGCLRRTRCRWWQRNAGNRGGRKRDRLKRCQRPEIRSQSEGGIEAEGRRTPAGSRPCQLSVPGLPAQFGASRGISTVEKPPGAASSSAV